MADLLQFRLRKMILGAFNSMNTVLKIFSQGFAMDLWYCKDYVGSWQPLC